MFVYLLEYVDFQLIYIDILLYTIIHCGYTIIHQILMGMPSRTSWMCSRTSMTDDTNVSNENVPVGSILRPRNHPIEAYYT